MNAVASEAAPVLSFIVEKETSIATLEKQIGAMRTSIRDSEKLVKTLEHRLERERSDLYRARSMGYPPESALVGPDDDLPNFLEQF